MENIFKIIIVYGVGIIIAGIIASLFSVNFWLVCTIELLVLEWHDSDIDEKVIKKLREIIHEKEDTISELERKVKITREESE